MSAPAAFHVAGAHGPALLVPVALDAVVLTELSINTLGWSWNPPNYQQMRFFQPPTAILVDTPPSPLTPDGQLGRTGTVLRWALPDALTHAGKADEVSGALIFPAVPNRWLVQRRVAGQAGATVAWILASDYLDGTGSSFPVGNTPTTLGKCWEVSAWPGEAALPAGLQPPLTAIGPGDPSFAAFAPDAQHMFAFHDPLTGVASGAVSYLVVGWYAGTTPDPLDPASGWQTGDEWTAVMDALGWSVGTDLPDAAAAARSWAAAHGGSTDPTVPRTFLPSRTICHGTLSAVNWLGPSGPAQSGVPTITAGDPSTVPRVTIAHTAADALATVVAAAAGQQTAEVAEALTALLTDSFSTLDEPDGAQQLALKIQASWFQQLPGGIAWQAAEPEQPRTPTADPKPVLTAAQAALLDALNDAQTVLDAVGRELTGRQWELYALWWKVRYLATTGANPIPAAQQTIQALFSAAQTSTGQTVAAWRSAEKARDDATTALSAVLGTLTLKSVPQPVFWRPNDPLLMVQGVGRSYAHGEDGRYTTDGSLYCRFSGQSISGLLVDGTALPVTAATLNLSMLSVTDAPDDLADLAVESYLLDPANADAIAAAANPAQPPATSVVAAQQTLVWNSLVGVPLEQQTLAEAAGLTSLYGPVAVPSKVGINYWTPPWSPLFLDWSVLFYPTGPALSGWIFPSTGTNDPLAAETAEWTGPSPHQTTPLQGRTLLTPHAADAMAARLHQLVDQFGDTPEMTPYLTDVADAIDYLHDAAVLSQGLSGFADSLLQRDPTPFHQPDLTALGPWLAPSGAPAYTPTSAPSPNGSTTFSPVGGGFMALQQLWIIDAFGQRYDVLKALQDNASGSGDLLGPDLRPSIGSGLVPLRPRLFQAARLMLTFVDAQDGGKLVGRSTSADPLCGWLIPNRLDNGILVYDAAGMSQGELLVERNTALWLPAPDTVSAAGQTAPPDLIDPHLLAVVDGVLTAANSAGALIDLIGTISEASWAIAPAGPDVDRLSVLVGFPVAVVRARLGLELHGPPATSQSWGDTGQAVDGGVTAATFTVALGSASLYDDSLVGVVVDGDPGHLLSPYGPSPNGYVLPGTHGLQIDQPIGLTILMHPHGKVHAFSGILPPTTATLPPETQTVPLRSMEVSFRSGPLLTPATGVSAPLPAFGSGEWSWLQYRSTTEPALPTGVSPTDGTATLPDSPPTLRDGWLQLDLVAQPTAFTYAVTPSAVEAGTAAGPTSVTLIVTAYNGTGAPLHCNGFDLTLPTGEGATALTQKPERVVASSGQPDSWTIGAAGADRSGAFLARPVDSSAALDPGATLTFFLAVIDVCPGAGVVLIGVDETVGPATMHLDLPLEKIVAFSGATT